MNDWTMSLRMPPPDMIYLGGVEAELIDAFEGALAMLSVLIQEPDQDEVMSKMALIADDDSADSLSKHEVRVLACAVQNDKLGEPIVYDDVVSITAKYGRKPMNVPMIYKTIDRLVARGMLDEQAKSPGSKSRQYLVNENGKAAFRMAMLNAAFLQRHDQSNRVT